MYVKCYELMKISTFNNPVFRWLGTQWRINFIVYNEDIDKVLKDAILNQVSGVVILKSEQNTSYINDKIIDFANKENLTLFEMDYNVKLLDVTRDISVYIMQKQEKINYLDYFFHCHDS